MKNASVADGAAVAYRARLLPGPSGPSRGSGRLVVGVALIVITRRRRCTSLRWSCSGPSPRMLGVGDLADHLPPNSTRYRWPVGMRERAGASHLASGELLAALNSLNSTPPPGNFQRPGLERCLIRLLTPSSSGLGRLEMARPQSPALPLPEQRREEV